MAIRHGELMKQGKQAGEVILILPADAARALVEMAEAAAKANPRKLTWKALAKELEALECW